jgi:hypothetical protein
MSSLIGLRVLVFSSAFAVTFQLFKALGECLIDHLGRSSLVFFYV